MCQGFQLEDLWTPIAFLFIWKHLSLTPQEFLSLRMILAGSGPLAKTTAAPVISFQASFDLDHLSNCDVSFPPASACATRRRAYFVCEWLWHSWQSQQIRAEFEVEARSGEQHGGRRENSGLTVGLQLGAFNWGASSNPQITHILCGRFFTCELQSVFGLQASYLINLPLKPFH